VINYPSVFKIKNISYQQNNFFFANLRPFFATAYGGLTQKTRAPRPCAFRRKRKVAPMRNSAASPPFSPVVHLALVN
jgi:hypothetical protein